MKSSFEAFESAREEIVSLVERLDNLVRGIFGGRSAEEVAKEETAVVKEESVVAEAASAETVKSNGEAQAKEGRINQSELVRRYLGEHPEARNKDIIDMINKDHGIEVAASLVSALRAKGRSEKKKGRTAVVAKKTREVVSASSLIREHLERDPDASNEEVVKSLKKAKRISVKPTLVSSVRAHLKRKGFKTSKVAGRKPMKTAKVRKTRKGLPMPALVVKVLEKAPREGVKLYDLAEKVIAAGYDYRGKKGPEGVVQNVYQAVHALSKTIPHAGYEGKTAVVLHDEANKRWKLNPKAVKKDVA